MNDHSDNYEPPTLRSVLDRGGSLSDYVAVEMFEDLVVEVAHLPFSPDALRERYERLLDCAEIPGFEARAEEIRTEKLWAIQLIYNPDLLPRVFAILPEAEVRVRELAYAAKHPYPLTVREPEDRGDGTLWHCQSCGTELSTIVETLVVENPSYGGELPYPLHYCRGCVEMALDALTNGVR